MPEKRKVETKKGREGGKREERVGSKEQKKKNKERKEEEKERRDGGRRRKNKEGRKEEWRTKEEKKERRCGKRAAWIAELNFYCGLFGFQWKENEGLGFRQVSIQFPAPPLPRCNLEQIISPLLATMLSSL